MVTFTNPHGFSTFALYGGTAPGDLAASSGGVYYESLQEAVNDVADGGVITLLKDCEE